MRSGLEEKQSKNQMTNLPEARLDFSKVSQNMIVANFTPPDAKKS